MRTVDIDMIIYEKRTDRMNLLNAFKFMCFLLVFLILLSNIQISRADLAFVPSLEVRYVKGYRNYPGLVLHLPFLEKTGSMAFDISGSKNHGLLGLSENMNWLTDRGLHFGDGNNIIVNASTSLQNSHKTVVVQFMWDGKSTSTALYIYDDGWPNSGSMILFVHPATSRLYVEFMTKAKVQKNLWHAIVPNKLYTCIFHFDGLNYYLWLDTKSKSGSLEDVAELGLNNNLSIGSNSLGAIHWFSGNIYTVQVFNRSFSPIEILCLYNSFQETPRANAGSKYVIGGWIAHNNNSIVISGFEDIPVYLNQSYVTSIDEYGVYMFIIDLPQATGNYTYDVTVGNTSGRQGAYESVVVDQVLVSDFGSTTVEIGHKAIAWFKLKSEFDGQVVESGIVNLTGGLFTTWNSVEQRWEYHETRSKPSELALSVELVNWDKYGITVIHPDTRDNVAKIQWRQPSLESELIKWLLGIGPATFGVITILCIIFVFMRRGILNGKTVKPIDQLLQKVDNLLQSQGEKDRRYFLLHQFLCQLVEENPPAEVLEFLRYFFPDILKQLEEHAYTQNPSDYRGNDP